MACRRPTYETRNLRGGDLGNRFETLRSRADAVRGEGVRALTGERAAEAREVARENVVQKTGESVQDERNDRPFELDGRAVTSPENRTRYEAMLQTSSELRHERRDIPPSPSIDTSTNSDCGTGPQSTIVQELQDQLNKKEKLCERLQQGLKRKGREIEELYRGLEEAQNREIEATNDATARDSAIRYEKLRQVLRRSEAGKKDMMDRLLEAEAREMDLRRQLNRARQDLEEQTNGMMVLREHLLAEQSRVGPENGAAERDNNMAREESSGRSRCSQTTATCQGGGTPHQRPRGRVIPSEYSVVTRCSQGSSRRTQVKVRPARRSEMLFFG